MVSKIPEINQKIIGELGIQGMHCGNGTFADVYKYQVSEKECYAIKVFKECADQNDIENEASVMQKLMESQIEGIVKFFGKKQLTIKNVRKSYEATVFFLEYCEGSLEQLLDNTSFNEEQVIDFLNQTVATNIYLFDKQIFHRDIKLNNILYKTDKGKYVYKFADFGEGELNTKEKFTSIRTVRGTPFYFAPELRFEEYVADYNPAKSDIFSLGICLLQMIFGKKISFPSLQKPGKKTEFQAELTKLLLGLEKCFPQSKNIDNWKNIIIKMLEFDPEERCNPISLYLLMKSTAFNLSNNNQLETIAAKYKQNSEEILSDGAKYVGSYVDGQKQGKGTCLWADGRQYTGDWKNGKMHGQGEFKWGDGRKYQGGYNEDKKHGHGCFEWPDGRKYSGEWAEGKQHGKGTFINKDGVKREGEWTEGKRTKWLN